MYIVFVNMFPLFFLWGEGFYLGDQKEDTIIFPETEMENGNNLISNMCSESWNDKSLFFFKPKKEEEKKPYGYCRFLIFIFFP